MFSLSPYFYNPSIVIRSISHFFDIQLFLFLFLYFISALFIFFFFLILGILLLSSLSFLFPPPSIFILLLLFVTISLSLLYRPLEGGVVGSLKGHTGTIRTLQFNNTYLASAGAGDFSPRLWDAQSSSLIRTFPAHNVTVHGLNWIDQSSFVSCKSRLLRSVSLSTYHSDLPFIFLLSSSLFFSLFFFLLKVLRMVWWSVTISVPTNQAGLLISITHLPNTTKTLLLSAQDLFTASPLSSTKGNLKFFLFLIPSALYFASHLIVFLDFSLLSCLSFAIVFSLICFIFS